VNRDEAESARVAAVADALDHPRFGQPEAAGGDWHGDHDLAIACVVAVAAGNAELAPLLAVGWLDAAAIARQAEDADDAIGRCVEPTDDARFPASFAAGEADEGALADAERRCARLGNDRDFFSIGTIADDRPAAQLAIDIDRVDLDDADFGQAEGALTGPITLPRVRSFATLFSS
jgi:hypothetical protein